ncbi:hypothetical protein CEXT_558751 [Caerostris extrusa]|uniref:Uncharacterized protein n=1 Tax=Caerostris extrusa TaxID=172846 RepID=A0AAV4RND9_CAEEX|nr:hypothetical protein CEXT_558751 [Caerostris extrusa]
MLDFASDSHSISSSISFRDRIRFNETTRPVSRRLQSTCLGPCEPQKHPTPTVSLHRFPFEIESDSTKQPVPCLGVFNRRVWSPANHKEVKNNNELAPLTNRSDVVRR